TSLSVSRPAVFFAEFTPWFCKYNLNFARKSEISLPQSKN
ncbi:14730_t:CDS:1, partial [Racocetra fulgida]